MSENIPRSLGEAYAVTDQINADNISMDMMNVKTGGQEYLLEHRPLWSWDCNYKLDHDGALLFVSSRFYPPLPHYSDDRNWNGEVSIVSLGYEAIRKDFSCSTLGELTQSVDSYIRNLSVDLITWLRQRKEQT